MIEIAVIVTLLASGLGLSTPLLFAALGEKIAERAGVLNLGVEGMMIMGAFAGFMGAFITGKHSDRISFWYSDRGCHGWPDGFPECHPSYKPAGCGTGSLAVGSWLERLPVQAGIWYWYSPKSGTTGSYQHSWL